MRFRDFVPEYIPEGGWETTITQSTVIKPAMVKEVLKLVKKFIKDFNDWLPEDHPKIKMGHPTGSSAYHEVESEEDPEKIYGDIDLQVIAPYLTPDVTHGVYSGEWGKLTDQFIQSKQPKYLHVVPGEPNKGHPIFRLAEDLYVQVDFMWHPPDMAQWGRFRATPERGLKGTLMGNLYSTLGSMLNLSIQHSGIQYKTVDGTIVPFKERKNYQVHTIANNIETFVLDILKWLHRLQGSKTPLRVAPLLKKNPGLKTSEVKAQDVVNAIKGLAESFELNKMYGSLLLEEYDNAKDFVDKFLDQYAQKIQGSMVASKYDKAATPEAIKRAADTKQKLQQGLERVQAMF